jgi:hypothetical protein
MGVGQAISRHTHEVPPSQKPQVRKGDNGSSSSTLGLDEALPEVLKPVEQTSWTKWSTTLIEPVLYCNADDEEDTVSAKKGSCW